MKFKIRHCVHAIFLILIVYNVMLARASLESVRAEEIPFGISEANNHNKGIRILSGLEDRRHFLHIFHVPYIVCYFAAKGKWPFIPSNVQPRVDSLAKSIFSHNDGYIKQFCQKWIAIKECFRPLFGTQASDVEDLPVRSTACSCANYENDSNYFDKKYFNNVPPETIYNTIDFLESFLPPPTRKTRKKVYVRGRVDEMEDE